MSIDNADESVSISDADGLVRRPGEGKSLTSATNSVRFLADSGETGGHYGLVEYTAGPGFQGPKSHIHDEMEEGFYVLEGEFGIQLGTENVRAPAGTFVLIPRGTVHTFWNTGEGTARFLLIASPGGFERYFEELVPLVDENGYPPPEAMADLARKYKFRFAEPD